jgi:putative oxygen-independent coproporphyrinogen III oxidase
LITLSRPGSLSTLPPLSLYVHLPWCLQKCPYCDFNSHEYREDGARATLPEQRYLDALMRDLESTLPLVWGRRVHTIFIGGGTPSLFSPASIDRLIADIRARLPLEPGCEITLEANPGTFETDRFKGFRDAGVTRLSIGVQSFDDAKLKALGRVHNSDQARAAIDEARRAFATFNIDLMYALPGQSLADLQSDLQQALAFEPPHLSLYHLTVEPNTRFAVQPPPGLPDEDTAFDMLDHLAEATARAGLERYEVSAYAQAGHQCQHNLNYWQFGDYIGIGAGAHGKISSPDRIIRTVRWREPATYMDKAEQGLACSNENDVPLKSRAFEYMLNALRLKDGFELSRFAERTGLSVPSIAQALNEAEAKGLIERDLQRVWPTTRGFDFLSDLQGLFLND